MVVAAASPLGWEHINLTGNYTWNINRRVAKGSPGRQYMAGRPFFIQNQERHGELIAIDTLTGNMVWTVSAGNTLYSFALPD